MHKYVKSRKKPTLRRKQSEENHGEMAPKTLDEASLKPVSPLYFSMRELVYFFTVHTWWSWIFCDLLPVRPKWYGAKDKMLCCVGPTTTMLWAGRFFKIHRHLYHLHLLKVKARQSHVTVQSIAVQLTKSSLKYSSLSYTDTFSPLDCIFFAINIIYKLGKCSTKMSPSFCNNLNI